MGDHDHADAIPAQSADQSDDLHPGAPVLSEGRLVENQDPGGGRQRGGDRETALLPARKRVGIGPCVPSEIESGKQILGTRPGRLLVHARAQGPQHDLVENGPSCELMLGILEHVGDSGGQLP